MADSDYDEPDEELSNEDEEEQLSTEDEEELSELGDDIDIGEEDDLTQDSDGEDADLRDTSQDQSTTGYEYFPSEHMGKISIKFIGGGSIPVKPTTKKRVFYEFQPATLSGPLATVVSQPTPSQFGQRELELLQKMDIPKGFPGKSDTTTLKEALEFMPETTDYIPAAPKQVNQKATKDLTDPDAVAGNNGDEKAKTHNRLDSSQPPLFDIDRIFDAITKHAVGQGLIEASKPFIDSGLRVMTMCSGTEAPFVALNLVNKSLTSPDTQDKFSYEHVGSAEIEPWKQAFIERNFRPPQIFRDVTDFTAYAKKPSNEELWPVTAYGSREKPAEDVHMLIAGSSCVDYSALNLKADKKGTRAQGESARTLRGILDYADCHKPTLILLENVEGAPWAKVREKWSSVGYETVHVKLDTINYYLPQTRSRGYLFGIHIQQAEAADVDIQIALETWVEEMSRFQRRASSPYIDFALSEEDPRLLVARNKSEDGIGKQSSISWVACRKSSCEISRERGARNWHTVHQPSWPPPTITSRSRLASMGTSGTQESAGLSRHSPSSDDI